MSNTTNQLQTVGLFMNYARIVIGDMVFIVNAVDFEQGIYTFNLNVTYKGIAHDAVIDFKTSAPVAEVAIGMMKTLLDPLVEASK